MLFNSVAFLIFFVLVWITYWNLARTKLWLQNSFLLLASYVFYAWWDWRFLSLILLSSATDYFAGQAIHKSQTQNKRKAWLILSLLVNLGLLGFFKYFNFFVDSFADLLFTLGLSANIQTLNIILPVGISFYTFQTLSYTIDIYRRKIKPVDQPIPFFTFVAFFPQLVAGPIERASNLLPQFLRPRRFDYEKVVVGCRLILWGLFKKVVIADRLAILVDLVYGQPEAYSGFAVMLATLAFALQIYCDFSGYSDMAIGLARLLGFDLMKNFDAPYLARSLREFWQRWHISLSTWFRDYLYIPLGGNRNGKLWQIFNLMLTFLVSGLWHGANWTFLIWGAIHGLFMSVEALFRNINLALPTFIRWIMVFTIVTLAWVFFRAESLELATILLENMLQFEERGQQISGLAAELLVSWQDGLGLMLALLALMLIDYLSLKGGLNQVFCRLPGVLRWSLYYFLIAEIVFIRTFDNAPNFIYFQF